MPNARQQKDLASRLSELNFLIEQLQKDIKAIEQSGEIAPSGCWIVRYQAKGHPWWSLLVLQMDVP